MKSSRYFGLFFFRLGAFLCSVVRMKSFLSRVTQVSVREPLLRFPGYFSRTEQEKKQSSDYFSFYCHVELIYQGSYENEISFTCKLNSSSYEWLCTRPRFEREALGNSEMVYFVEPHYRKT